MKTPNYTRLSSLDHSFLLFETPMACMHVAATVVLDARPLRAANGKVDLGRIRRHIESRLHLIPTYRQRLHYVPVENRPIWVDDAEFDIGYHVRGVELPPPGGERQFRQRCAEILERPLNRAHPLWETWLVDGIEGDRCALVCKVHHCMVDGMAGVDLMNVLFDMEPIAEVAAAPAWTPRPVPSDAELLRDEVERRGRKALDLLRTLPRTPARLIESTRATGESLLGLWELVRTGLGTGMATPVNGELSPHRRIAGLTLTLEEVKVVRRALGATVNDVVLATVADGMRRFLMRRGGLPAQGAYRVAVPVNTMSSSARAGRTGNHVWAWLVELPLREDNPHARLAAIREQTLHLKDTRQAEAGEMLTEAIEWTSSNLLPLGIQLVNRSQHNLIVTNVPGPPLRLFVLDSPIEAIYPHLPLFEGQGIGIALLSYNGTLHWGITADWELVPDLDAFVKDLRDAFRELYRAASWRDESEKRAASGKVRRRRPQRATGEERPAVVAGRSAALSR